MRSSGGEHDRDGRGEHAGKHGHGENGEESGTEYGKGDVYDELRRGTRLVLSYDTEKQAFTGTVENTTQEVLDRVRVEVHLSNGKELGPTTSADLGPGEKREVVLTASNDDFERWSAHAEVGSDEHRHGHEREHGHGSEHGEHRGEHRERSSEHGGEH